MYRRIVSVIFTILTFVIMMCIAIACDHTPQSQMGNNDSTDDIGSSMDTTLNSVSDEYTEPMDTVDTNVDTNNADEDTTTSVTTEAPEETTTTETEAASSTTVETSAPEIETTYAPTTTEPEVPQSPTTTESETTEAPETTEPETTEAPGTTEPETTEAPETTAPGPSKILTYAEFLQLSDEEKTAYRKSFPSLADYFAWKNAAEAEYDAETDKNGIEDGDILDIEDILGKN